MRINNRGNFVIVLMVGLLFASMSACAKKPVAMVEQADVAKVEEVAAVEVSEAQDTGEAMGSAESLDTQMVADAGPLEGRTSAGLFPIYFDFDKSTVRSDQVERIDKNADFLKNNTTVRVRIEGNCDERRGKSGTSDNSKSGKVIVKRLKNPIRII